jgi:hypothetical protein
MTYDNEAKQHQQDGSARGIRAVSRAVTLYRRLTSTFLMGKRET